MNSAKHKNVARSLSDQWESYNLLDQARGGAILVLVSMGAFILIDGFLIDNPELYRANQQLRIAFILFAVFSLWLLNRVSRDDTAGAIPARSRVLVYAVVLGSMIVVANAMYLYFILSSPKAYKMAATFGAVIVIFCIHMLSYRFSKPYFLAMGGSMILTLLAMIALETDRSYLQPVLTSHLGMGIVTGYLRFKFKKGLYQSYVNQLAIAPPRIAKQIVISNSDLEKTSAFAPKHLFTACLISDWRNYQEICAKLSPKQISDLLSLYYDKVFTVLDEIISAGNYYAHWNADELFIVIFETDGISPQDVLKISDQVTQRLATDVFVSVNEAIDTSLMYDIGIATGIGLVGLQGPKGNKKTTVIGSVPGLAKRYETEAKLIRAEGQQQGKPIPTPIVVFVSDVAFDKASVFKNARQRVASSKDISGQVVQFWYAGIDINNNKVLDFKGYQEALQLNEVSQGRHSGKKPA